MIDFLKVEVRGVDPILIRKNPLLEFRGLVGRDTAIGYGSYIHAPYQGLTFKYYDPTMHNPGGRVTIEGSLHKYYNLGEHNYNDFGINNLNEVLEEITCLFHLSPSNMVIRQIEIGVNMQIKQDPDEVIAGLLMHKRDRFESKYHRDEGTYYQVSRSEKWIKVYNKTRHYRNKGKKPPENIFRFEIKYNKMRFLQRRYEIYNLQNLLDYGLAKIAMDVLPFEWSQILFYDKDILKGDTREDRYGSLRFWLNQSSANFGYHKRELRKIYRDHPENQKDIVANFLKDKILSLADQTINIHPLYIG